MPCDDYGLHAPPAQQAGDDVPAACRRSTAGIFYRNRTNGPRHSLPCSAPHAGPPPVAPAF